ncbi:GlxA family transcriptional regulator [Paraglaciecola sp. 2405UD69-4]|uniref:GlxA family transcriptional regulator n=1 Tax=Paraglaciecola sp. 2405UD69-4 TaxID=3391836 RepID=UPI0039C96957
MQKASKNIHIYVVLIPSGLLLDTVGPVEVFNYANRIAGERFSIHYVGADPNISNSVGISIKVAPLPDYIESSAWVLVPGMLGETIELETKAVQQTCEWLQQHNFQKLVSVCGGSLILAKAGLLSSKKCTTHYMHIEQLAGLVGAEQVLENRLFVQDDNVYTSAGVSAGIDLALYLVEQEFDGLVCAKIARRMVLFTRRGAQDPAESPLLEHRNHLNQKVHQVQDLILAEPANQWSLSHLASQVHCSERHLSRIFKQHTGLSTKAYLYKIRLTIAKGLLNTSNLPIEQVASRCGFNDPRQFRRLWARENGHSPSVYRAKQT